MNLKFGTGGLRAVMGEGPDRLNIETIREATLGVAAYAKKNAVQPKVAVAYDSREHSEEFGRETARVLALMGCRVFIYPQLSPTPTLSFAVRYLQCDLGICITASHNPAEYNGYKVYGSDGGQITNEAADAIQKEICAAELSAAEDGRSFAQFLEEGSISLIGEDTLDAFIEEILKKRTKKELTSDLKLVYTPLNGSGLHCILKVLKAIGVKDVLVVPEQEKPDGKFPTCPYPNPEELEALVLGLSLCRETGADLLIATDPDSDRIGAAAKKGADYERLTGNQVGILLLDYLLKCKKEAGTLPERPVVVKTIVTTTLVEKIAAAYGIEVINTLTGFKYIGEQIGRLERAGEKERYLFGLEESCGYLIGDYVRDKDAVGAAMLLCEMADTYKAQGRTLWDVLDEIYEAYGHYETSLKSFKFAGAEAAEEMRKLRTELRENPQMKMNGLKVLDYKDYLDGIDGLPKSDVLKIWREDGSEIVIRPSGTEPKIKVYIEKLV